jgi:hypothetical protein
VSSTGEGDNPKSISETWSKVVVDMPGFAEASQEYQGRSAATPVNDLKSDILSGLTGHGNESDMLCGRVDPVGPFGVGPVPRRKELWALLAERACWQGPGTAGLWGSRRLYTTAAAARREAGDCE